MNGWETGDKLTLSMGARPTGLYFLDDVVDIYAKATVEGMIKQVSGEWVTLLSSYSIPSGGQGKPSYRDRIVVVRCARPVSDKAVGSLGLAVGTPQPKYNDQWYLHLEAENFWVLWGKK